MATMRKNLDRTTPGVRHEPLWEVAASSADHPVVRRIRRHIRLPTSIRAVLYHKTTFQPTTIRNVSCGGLGLDGAMGLFPGDRVTIRLMTGHQYTGNVRWWLANHCGIELDEEIDRSDHLIALAERKPRPGDEP